MYTENLPDIFRLLEVSAQSGMLTLTPAKDVAGSSWEATCLLREGKLSELKIRQPADGTVLLGGAAALDWLYKQKGVYWHFKELPPEALPAPVPGTIAGENMRRMQDARSYQPKASSGFSMGYVPRLTPLGIQLGVPPNKWPREHRTVFLLIDGARSKAEILRLLPATFALSIYQLLSELKSAGFIE